MMLSKIDSQSTYTHDYCLRLVEHMSQGFSFETFGVAVCEPKVSRATLYIWVERHPEFSWAKEVARDEGQLFWETIGRDGLVGDLVKFNAAAWIYSMKCRFGGEWLEDSKETDGKNLEYREPLSLVRTSPGKKEAVND